MKDIKTAEAFATSWNNLPGGSVYTFDQFEDWFAPLQKSDFKGKEVLELGCGNASLLVHATQWEPSNLVGIDLGESIVSANQNMSQTGFKNY
jgi:tRNA G46 methylase TrmB